ncbi:MAG: twin-arginine translocation signal domain-containing protein, partial [Gammaproteobacteria bacterium]
MTNRRTFLKGTLGATALGLAASAGLLKPTQVLAAEWPKNAFEAKSINDALSGLFGSS